MRKVLSLFALVSSLLTSTFARVSPSTVIAKVGDATVTRGDLDKRLQEEGLTKLPLEQVYMKMLEELIAEKLLDVACNENNVHENPEFKKALANQKKMLELKFLMLAEARKKVTDADVKKEYAVLQKEVKDKKEMRPRVLLTTEEKVAKDAVKSLKAGKKFEDLAKEHSMPPFKENGGKPEEFLGEANFPEAVKKAFVNLKPGQYTRAPLKHEVDLGNGKKMQLFYLLKKDSAKDIRPLKLPAISDPELNQKLKDRAAIKKIEDVQKTVFSKYKVTRFDPEGKTLYLFK